MNIRERYTIHGRALLYAAALLSCAGGTPMAVLILVGVGTMATIYAVFSPAEPSVTVVEEAPGTLVVTDIGVVPDRFGGGVA